MANQNPLSDRDWLKVKQQFKRYVRREEYRAQLGDETGTIDEPGYPGYVRVRYSQQEGNPSQPTTLPFEANMLKQTGAAVIVGYDDNGDLAVLRPDVATQRTQGINTLSNNAQDPNVTFYIGQQRIITLNSHPISSASDSMVVTIQNWFYIKNGTVHYFTGGDGNETPIDLTSYIPGSANEECLACLFIKPDDTAEVIASTPKNAAIGVDISDVQECLDGSTAGGFPVWAWRLYHGQTGITPGALPSGGDDFLDLRQFINVIMDTVSSSLTVTDGSTTVTDVTEIDFNGSDFTITDLGSGVVQVDLVTPSAQIFPIAATIWQQQSSFLVGSSSWSYVYASAPFGYILYQTSAANGDSFQTAPFLIAAGTYTFHVLGATDPNRGKLDWYLDADITPFDSGQDWYDPSNDYAVEKTHSITIPTSGNHTITAIVNGKNASSIGFYHALVMMWIE